MPHNRGQRLSASEKTLMERDYHAGLDIVAIAAKYDRAPATVRKHVEGSAEGLERDVREAAKATTQAARELNVLSKRLRKENRIKRRLER
jgi:hypothetical protein